MLWMEGRMDGHINNNTDRLIDLVHKESTKSLITKSLFITIK